MQKGLACICILFVTGCAQTSHLPRIVDESLPSPAYKHQYTAHKGDTIYSIAFANDLDFQYLAALNGLKYPYTLHPGDRLRVRKQPSKKIISLKSKGKKGNLIQPAKQSAQVWKAQPVRFSADSATENIPPKDHEKTAEKGLQQKNSPEIQKNYLNQQEISVQSWIWPLQGNVLKAFSSGQMGNKGIDIAGHLGSRVLAAASGTVVYSGNGLRGYGNLLIIKHNTRFLSAYAYNDRLNVKEGERVTAGQAIATVGRAASGQLMLHFEIRRDGLPVDPMRYLR